MTRPISPPRSRPRPAGILASVFVTIRLVAVGAIRSTYRRGLKLSALLAAIGIVVAGFAVGVAPAQAATTPIPPEVTGWSIGAECVTDNEPAVVTAQVTVYNPDDQEIIVINPDGGPRDINVFYTLGTGEVLEPVGSNPIGDGTFVYTFAGTSEPGTTSFTLTFFGGGIGDKEVLVPDCTVSPEPAFTVGNADINYVCQGRYGAYIEADIAGEGTFNAGILVNGVSYLSSERSLTGPTAHYAADAYLVPEDWGTVTFTLWVGSPDSPTDVSATYSFPGVCSLTTIEATAVDGAGGRSIQVAGKTGVPSNPWAEANVTVAYTVYQGEEVVATANGPVGETRDSDFNHPFSITIQPESIADGTYTVGVDILINGESYGWGAVSNPVSFSSSPSPSPSDSASPGPPPSSSATPVPGTASGTLPATGLDAPILPVVRGALALMLAGASVIFARRVRRRG